MLQGTQKATINHGGARTKAKAHQAVRAVCFSPSLCCKSTSLTKNADEYHSHEPRHYDVAFAHIDTLGMKLHRGLNPSEKHEVGRNLLIKPLETAHCELHLVFLEELSLALEVRSHEPPPRLILRAFYGTNWPYFIFQHLGVHLVWRLGLVHRLVCGEQ